MGVDRPLLNLNLKNLESPEGGGAGDGAGTGVGGACGDINSPSVELDVGEFDELPPPPSLSLWSRLALCVGVPLPEFGIVGVFAERRQPTSLEEELCRRASSSISLFAIASLRLDWARVSCVSRSAEVW